MRWEDILRIGNAAARQKKGGDWRSLNSADSVRDDSVFGSRRFAPTRLTARTLTDPKATLTKRHSDLTPLRGIGARVAFLLRSFRRRFGAALFAPPPCNQIISAYRPEGDGNKFHRMACRGAKGIQLSSQPVSSPPSYFTVLGIGVVLKIDGSCGPPFVFSPLDAPGSAPAFFICVSKPLI
jgi:hypothetical protein